MVVSWPPRSWVATVPSISATRDVGADDLQSFGGHEGGVDGVAGRASGEHVEHLLGDVDGDPLLRLDGRAGEVGGDDDALLLEEGGALPGAPR